MFTELLELLFALFLTWCGLMVIGSLGDSHVGVGHYREYYRRNGYTTFRDLFKRRQWRAQRNGR